MKNIYFYIIAFIFGSIFTFTGCAKRGSITGGLKDTIAPKITGSSPENYSTKFIGKEIKISFNELIKVKDINKQLIISPPMKKTPIIIPQGSASKFISIKILDTLKKNTTYSFNFGQSITDNNEGNPYSQFKYVFSTGTHIDSLNLIGKIKDAKEQKPDNFVSIQLYDAQTFNDSTIYKEVPLYVTNTLDSLKLFKFENLKAGTYKIIALKDKNNNYKFDSKTDKIAFLKESITLPNDTIYELELFKEEFQFKANKIHQESKNKYLLSTQGDAKNTKVTATSGNKEIKVRVTKFPTKNKDSLQVFVSTTNSDSITFNVENGTFKKSFTSKYKDLKALDSLQIDTQNKGNITFRQNFTLVTSTPIEKIDNSKITLIKKDSTSVKFETKYNEFDREIVFEFQKEEDEKYNLQLLPGAIIDFYEKPNDTLKFSIKTKLYSDYGNLKVNLKNVKRFPVILEILDPKGDVVESGVSIGNESLIFNLIEPNIYSLRIIYDDNKNGVWNSGSYLEKRQAEEIIYYNKTIDVRANWDVDQDFILD